MQASKRALQRFEVPYTPKCISRNTARKLLSEAIRLDQDFDGFVMDYFDGVYRRFGNGMDRVSKTNVLLTETEPLLIVESLRNHYRQEHAKLNEIEKLLLEDGSIENQADLLLREQLNRLQLDRAHKLAQGNHVSELDNEIRRLKYQLQRRPYLSDGDILNDRYLLVELIGQGGFAKIWQAYDIKTNLLVAVKVLREANEEKSRIERFSRGARCMQRIKHPHVVRVLDGPACHEGFHYFIMDYFSGGDLRSQVTNHKLSRSLAVTAVLSVGSALLESHAHGFYHRDVKPPNILLDWQKKAYLSDFDLVRAPDTNAGTRTAAMGTYLYAAPETQTNASQVDHRADIFSLARVMMFILNGKDLDFSVMSRREEFFAQLACSEALKQVLKRATEDLPEERPQSMAELCALLVEALPGNLMIEPAIVSEPTRQTAATSSANATEPPPASASSTVAARLPAATETAVFGHQSQPQGSTVVVQPQMVESASLGTEQTLRISPVRSSARRWGSGAAFAAAAAVGLVAVTVWTLYQYSSHRHPSESQPETELATAEHLVNLGRGDMDPLLGMPGLSKTQGSKA